MQAYGDDVKRTLAFEQARTDRINRTVVADVFKYAVGAHVHTVAILRNSIGGIERKEVIGTVQSISPNVVPTTYVISLPNGQRIIRCAADLGMVTP